MPVFGGELWTVDEAAADCFGLYRIRHCDGGGLNPEANTINTGGNSGFAAVHLAAVFQGAQLPGFPGAKIGLLGFDMQRTGGKSHSHGDHVKPLANGTNFNLWLQRFAPLAKHLKERGVHVTNCSRATAMRCFPRAPLEEFLP